MVSFLVFLLSLSFHYSISQETRGSETFGSGPSWPPTCDEYVEAPGGLVPYFIDSDKPFNSPVGDVHPDWCRDNCTASSECGSYLLGAFDGAESTCLHYPLSYQLLLTNSVSVGTVLSNNNATVFDFVGTRYFTKTCTAQIKRSPSCDNFKSPVQLFAANYTMFTVLNDNVRALTNETCRQLCAIYSACRAATWVDYGKLTLCSLLTRPIAQIQAEDPSLVVDNLTSLSVFGLIPTAGETSDRYCEEKSTVVVLGSTPTAGRTTTAPKSRAPTTTKSQTIGIHSLTAIVMMIIFKT